MYNKLINLLPLYAVKRVHKEYLVRLSTVVVVAFSVLVLVQMALLFPSYTMLQARYHQLKTTSEYLAQITAQNIQSIKTRINALNAQATFLGTLSTTPSATVAIKQVLNIARNGVILKEITYTAPQKGKQAQIIISGIANDRRTLQAYQESLQLAPYISSADLPVSVYAKDTNIKFTITLTGSFLP
ncbi:MAG TPA: hypothetical protein ENI56_01560 [Candidatus Kaiserbacteria bacterium]|nr:hypothetical protein [Candidatus Kaiserbacteria bacterium]